MVDMSEDALYPIAVLIDELKNEDVQVGAVRGCIYFVTSVLQIEFC